MKKKKEIKQVNIIFFAGAHNFQVPVDELCFLKKKNSAQYKKNYDRICVVIAIDHMFSMSMIKLNFRESLKGYKSTIFGF